MRGAHEGCQTLPHRGGPHEELLPVQVDNARFVRRFEFAAIALNVAILETVVQHEEDDDDFNEADIEVAKEMREEGGGGVEQLLAGLGNNDDANLLDIGDGIPSDDASQSLSGDLFGGGGEGGQSQPPSGTENERGAEAAATADLLGL